MREVTKINSLEQTKVNDSLHRKKDGKDFYYGVCPICENPIIIVNLYKQERKLHGRHGNQSIPHLAKLDVVSRNSCKYYTGKSKDEEGTQREKNAKINKVYAKSMRDNFDIHVAYFEKITGIELKNEAYRERLISWINNDKSRDYECTNTTLPFTLFYGLVEHQLFGKKIRVGSPIYEILSSSPLCEVVELKKYTYNNLCHIEGKPGAGFFFLKFNLEDYHRKMTVDRCVETMELRVLYRKQAGTDAELYTKVIEIDSQDWFSFCNNYSKPRNQELLGIAQEAFRGADLDLNE